MKGQSSGAERGVVLLNALIMVAVISFVAVMLLQKAEASRNRLFMGQTSTQTALYLDAFEALVAVRLTRDSLQSERDHLNEAWAKPIKDASLDRGQISGTIADMQGKFNVNWLASEEDTEAKAAFSALLARLGVSPTTAVNIVGFLSREGPANAKAYTRRAYPVRPVGGPIQMLDQLRSVPGVSDKIFDRISQNVTAVPAGRRLNVNTVSAGVLLAFYPKSDFGSVSELLARRRLKPFDSVDEYTLAARKVLGEAAVRNVESTRFTVSSRWFEAHISATLGQTTLARRAIFFRTERGGKAQVVYRLAVGR